MAVSGPLLMRRHTADGWCVLRVPYTAVPGYDFAAATEGMTEEDIRREILLDWTATSGARVYTGYNPEFHLATEPLRFDVDATFYCGWDFGGCPAFVVTQLNGYGQWLILSALAPPEGLSLETYQFGEMVADHLLHTYALPADMELEDLKLVHFGDPAGNAPPPRTKATQAQETRTHFQILRDGVRLHLGYDPDGKEIVEERLGWGWRIQSGAVSFEARKAAVQARLSTLLRGGAAALVVDPNCTVIAEGLGGGYHYPQKTDGRYELEPLKNWHSHGCNAMEYIATRLFKQPEKKDRDEHPRRQQIVSAASGQRERGVW
jgi:hypothetical protein